MSVSVLDKEVVSREVIRSISESRRSIRSFVPDSLPEEDVREILRLTGLAPSASNVQTWRWAVVSSPVMKARLSEVMTGNNVQTAANAPVNIVLYSDGQRARQPRTEHTPGHGRRGSRQARRRHARAPQQDGTCSAG